MWRVPASPRELLDVKGGVLKSPFPHTQDSRGKRERGGVAFLPKDHGGGKKPAKMTVGRNVIGEGHQARKKKGGL